MKQLSLYLFANKELLSLIVLGVLISLALYFLLHKKFKKQLFIIILTSVYALLTFYNLGSLKGPESFYEVTQDNSQVILEVNDENPNFDHIYTMSIEGVPSGDNRYQIYYQGIIVEASNDQSNWQFITELNATDWGKWDVFACPMNYSYRYLRLTFTNKSGVLNEIGLYDALSDRFLDLRVLSADDYTYDPNNLVDEKDQIVAQFDYQNETFFDEIYHVRNAYEIANELPFYTAVHPLLGTRFIAWGIELFGMNPFGYRFFGALVSVLLLPCIYLLAKEVFNKARIANLAALLFALDFMHYTTGRIATLEPFSILWIILMYLFMVKFMQINYLKKLPKALLYLALSGLMMALAWATKWTGIYASIGLALCFFYKLYQVLRYQKAEHKIKKTIIVLLTCLLCFVIIPAIVYVVAFRGIYIYDALPSSIPEAIKQVIDYTEYMFTYHSGLETGHPYASKWYMWLLDIRPIWYYVNNLGTNIQSISCFNNPVISLFGLFSIFFTIYKTFKTKDMRGIIILLGYLSALLPWVFITRTTFAYHYYPAIPFLILGICYYFDMNSQKEKLLRVFLIITVVLFVLFLPVISGFETWDFYVSNIIRFLPSWYFG